MIYVQLMLKQRNSLHHAITSPLDFLESLEKTIKQAVAGGFKATGEELDWQREIVVFEPVFSDRSPAAIFLRITAPASEKRLPGRHDIRHSIEDSLVRYFTPGPLPSIEIFLELPHASWGTRGARLR